MSGSTTNKGYVLPTVNGDLNVWGTGLNTSLNTIDSNMGSVATVAVGGGVDITPSASQAKCLVQSLTGILTGNISYKLPAAGGFYIIDNLTTGAYTLTVKTVAGGSTGVACAQGYRTLVYSDATDVHAVAAQPSSNAIPWVVAGGTADALTATYSPAVTALVDGLILGFRAASANATTTPTFAPNGLTAHTITKGGGTALVAGDIVGNLAEYLVRYNLANTRWELLNPSLAAAQPLDADLTALAANGTSGFWARTGAGTGAARTLTESTGITITNPAGTAGDPTVAVATAYRSVGVQTVPVLAAAMIPATTSGPSRGQTETTTHKVNVITLDFADDEIAWFNVPLPKGWNLGTVTFIPFATIAAGSGNIIFTLAGVAISHDDPLDVAVGTSQSSTITITAVGDVLVGPESSAITIAGTPANNDLICFKVTRSSADTLGANDAKLIGLKLFITLSAANDA